MSPPPGSRTSGSSSRAARSSATWCTWRSPTSSKGEPGGCRRNLRDEARVRRLAHLSDLHFGRVDPAAVEGLVRSLEAARPDLVVVSGDFTQSARTQEFRAARAFLDRLAAPGLGVPGNHDLPQWNPVERLVRPYDRYRLHIAEELEPVW